MQKLFFILFSFFLFGQIIVQAQDDLPVIQYEDSTKVKAKKSIGQILIAGVGLGLTGFGISERIKANEIYNEQYLSQTNRLASLEVYEQANNKLKKSNRLIYAGVAVLVIDTAIFLIKNKKRKTTTQVNKLSFHSSYVPQKELQIGFQYIIGQ